MKKITFLVIISITLNLSTIFAQNDQKLFNAFYQLDEVDSLIRMHLDKDYNEYIVYIKSLDIKSHYNYYYITKCKYNYFINIIRLSYEGIYIYRTSNYYFPSYQYLQENSYSIQKDTVRTIYQQISGEPLFGLDYYYDKRIIINKGYLYRRLIPETHLSIFVNMIERDLLGILEGSYYVKYSDKKENVNKEIKNILKKINCKDQW